VPHPFERNTVLGWLLTYGPQLESLDAHYSDQSADNAHAYDALHPKPEGRMPTGQKNHRSAQHNRSNAKESAEMGLYRPF
jgi:hypothetical protein